MFETCFLYDLLLFFSLQSKDIGVQMHEELVKVTNELYTVSYSVCALLCFLLWLLMLHNFSLLINCPETAHGRYVLSTEQRFNFFLCWGAKRTTFDIFLYCDFLHQLTCPAWLSFKLTLQSAPRDAHSHK